MSDAPHSRDRIDIVKGMLILAVIVGHNEAMTYNFPWLRQLLYYFHVQCFFLLSSFLDTKPFSLPWLRDRAVRYLVPYAWFVGLCWLAYVVLRTGADDMAAAARLFGRAIALSDGPAIYAATGMRYLWFMPALFSFAVMKAIAMRWPTYGKGLTVVAWGWMVVAALVIPRLPDGLPWGIGSALFFFGLGQAATYAATRLSLHATRTAGFASACLTAAMSALIVFIPLDWVAAAAVDSYDIRRPATWLVGVCYPCVMLAAIYYASGSAWLSAGHLPGRVLAAFGRWSLPIYLLHVPVYRVLTRAWFGRGFDDLRVVGPALGAGVVILLLTIILSLGLSAGLWSLPMVRRAVFPRSWGDVAIWRVPRGITQKA